PDAQLGQGILQMLKRPPHSLLLALVDPSDRNVTFESALKWKRQAADELVDPYRDLLLSLTAEDCQFIDALRAIRNFVAHLSGRAQQKMNEALSRLPRGMRGTRRKVHMAGLGSYLTAHLENGVSRHDYLYRRLYAIAG